MQFVDFYAKKNLQNSKFVCNFAVSFEHTHNSTMKKLKLYLDTSVISHLDAPDTPEKTAETLAFWEILKTGKYDVVISDVVMDEIRRCTELKRMLMIVKIAEIKPITVEKNEEVEALAHEYVRNNILSQRSFDDCRHIALSVVNSCDYLVSWNFKHLVNVRTVAGVKVVNAINNYREISIVSPNMLIE